MEFKNAVLAQSPGLIWRSDLVGRLDAIGYDHEAYGRVTGDYVLEKRKTAVDQWKQAAQRLGNETIFKNRLSIFDSLDRIVTSSPAERRAIIYIFRDHGYETFPDGRELEEAIQ